jgi:hypothetical protein
VLGEPVHLVGAVNLQTDGEADASRAWLGFGVPVASKLGQWELGQHDAAQLEDREVVVVHHLRPAHAPVEVAQGTKVAGAKSVHIGECVATDQRPDPTIPRTAGEGSTCGELLARGPNDSENFSPQAGRSACESHCRRPAA